MFDYQITLISFQMDPLVPCTYTMHGVINIKLVHIALSLLNCAKHSTSHACMKPLRIRVCMNLDMDALHPFMNYMFFLSSHSLT